MLFDKKGYLLPGISEAIVMNVIRKYAEIMDNSVAVCKKCGGDKKITCPDPECYVCAMDDYCKNSSPCPCQKISQMVTQIINPLTSRTLTGFDILSRPPIFSTETEKSKVKNHKSSGLNCTKCNVLNEYLTEGNQSDGTYICYDCRSISNA